MNVLRIFAVVCLTLLILLTSAIAAIRFFFPTEEIRRQLERALSEHLQGTVRIATLEWNLLHGIRLGNVEIERNGTPLAKFDHLSLQYHLLTLLQGSLLINEFALAQADVFIDLAHLPVSSTAEPLPSQEKPTPLPTLPLAITVESFRVEQSRITVVGTNDFHVTLRDVNFSSRLHATSTITDLSGVLEIGSIDTLMNQHSWRLPLHLAFALSVDRPAERVILERVEIRSAPLFNFVATGRIDHLASTQEVTFSVRESTLDLAALLALVQPLLSPPLTDLRLGGTIIPTITITGAQTDKGFEGMVSLDIKGRNIHSSSSTLGISLETAAFQLQTGEIPIRANRPGPLHADLSLSTAGMATGLATAREVTLHLQADRNERGQLALHLMMKAQVSAALASAKPRLSAPFTLEVTASGDETALSFSLTKVKAALGDFIHLVANGAIGPLGPTGRERPVSLHATVRSDAVKLLRVLPPSLLHGFEPRSQESLHTVSFSTTGLLDDGWRPLRVDTHLSLDATGLRAAAPAQGLEGTLDQLALALRAVYRAKDESLQGTIDGTIRLKDLRQGTTATVGAVAVTLNSAVNGRIGTDLAVHRLAISNRLISEIREVRYDSPTLTGTFPHLTTSVKAHADLFKRLYVLDMVSFSAGQSLNGTMSGSFHPGNQHFSMEMTLPSLNIAEIRRHISGPALKSLASVNPEGFLSLHITGEGSLPTPNDLAQLQLPLRALAQVELKNVSGSFQDYAISGATGKITLSLDPPEDDRHHQQLVRTLWQIGADRLEVSGDGPVKHLDKVTLVLEGSAESFDRLILNRLVISANGLNATLNTELSGVKRLLTKPAGTPLLDGLAPLFARSTLQVTVDLERLAGLIRSFGLTGTGQTGLTVFLQKKEQGPLDLRVTVQPQQLSITHGDDRIERLNGTIEIRKVLQWSSSADGQAHETMFRPTTVLPDLQLTTPSHRNLRIGQIKAGPLAVHNLSALVSLDHNRFVLQNLAMNLLGGGLGGEVVVTGGKAFRVDLRMEATGLDANHLLPVSEQVPGDSLIDATVTGTIAFDDQQGRLDFGKSTVELSLTRIGRHTLDRLLQFLDPTSSNPSIVGARSAVKLANPSSARILLSKGLLTIRIAFQQGLLSRFEMDRIPISQIKQFRDLTTTIPQWNDLRRLMLLLGADRYGLDQTGTFVLE